ncbi:cytochrome P450 2J1-like isoform X1 [Carcharodon carcharias]|uniref:cytochrome P450 2J1-like isoform X1 n=1 Tax=Carcharodon carcharias TaxID=13397 RepID=UPI001B7DE6FB|nr:cytochrome P450 2J1-like isoform X1 [Carcharodon carcharias]
MVPKISETLPYFSLAWLWIWIAVVLLLLFVLRLVRSRRPVSFPPGPINLSFLGNFLQLSPAAPHQSLKKLGRKYGNIFSLSLGAEFLLILDGSSIVREALVHHGEAFSGRPISPLFLRLKGPHGITFSNGSEWREQRRFAVSHLSNLLPQVKPWIMSEARSLSARFAEHHDEPFDPHLDISQSVYSAMYQVLFGHHLDYSDPNFRAFMQHSKNIAAVIPCVSVKLYNLLPTVMQFMPGAHQRLFAEWDQLVSILLEQVQHHQLSRNPETPRDFTDCYLNKMEKVSGDGNSTFTMKNLIACATDLIMGGTETIVSVLRWLVLYMTAYPSIQDKVHHEIDIMIGRHKEPSWMDRVKLPYTNAVIHEVLRLGNIIPLNVPRQTTRDVQLKGYRIPKGTTVIPSLTGVLFDGKQWESPNVFNPNRYLAANGQFCPVDAHLPFSTGHRMCIGVRLAEMEIFLFFTALMQYFHIEAAGRDYPLDLHGVYGATLAPKAYRICVHRRK